MKKTVIFCLLVLLLAVSFTSCTKVPAGYVGVKVHLLGSEKGVQNEVLGVGRYHIGMNEELYRFPTFQQNIIWTADETEGSPKDDSFTFQTVEGLSINADVSMSYQLDETKISELFQKYRKGIEEITNVFIKNEVRNAFQQVASTKTAEYIYGEGKTETVESVTKIVSERLLENGIIVDNISFIGSLRLPQSIQASISAKVEATNRAQQRENELRETEAEVAKTIAKAEGDKRVAELQADANRILSASLTDQILENKQIEMMQTKWNGVMPYVMGEGSSPIIDLR